MRSSARWLALAALVLGGGGCGDDSGLTLLVDLRTDFRPADEFAAVEVELRGAGDDRHTSTPALARDDFLTGERVAELEGLPEADVTVHVALIDTTGATVAQRSTEVALEEDFGLTVVVTRDCLDTRCPGSGDAPTHTQCHGGHCVDPRCHDGRVDACGSVECTDDSHCNEGSPCARGYCAAGACLFGTDAMCVPDAGAGDAGPVDAGRRSDAGPADAGRDGGCAGDADCGDRERCAMDGTCVPRCAEDRVDPYMGDPCAPTTWDCLSTCMDSMCSDSCFDSDPMPTECRRCYDYNLISCVNDAGCQSEWNCVAACAEAHCAASGPLSDCASTACEIEYEIWNRCGQDVVSDCSGEILMCFDGSS